MQNYQANIEDLSKCTVAIQEPGENGRILGTGVIVTDDGLVLTCYHVIRNTQNKTLDNEKNFNIYFSNTKKIRHAQIIEEYCNPSLDIAFLQLKYKLPEYAIPVNLSESVYSEHRFQSFGFRKSTRFDGLYAAGQIRGKVIVKAKKGFNLSIQLYSDEIAYGMSGAPILDLETNKVVGIVSEHWITTDNVDTRLNFAIPIESIIKSSRASSLLKEKNPGLSKISWRDRVRTALHHIEIMYSQHKNENKKGYILNTSSIKAIKLIPIFGSILVKWYNNISASNEDKAKEICLLLQALQQLNEEQFISLAGDLKSNEMVKNRDLVIELAAKTQNMIGGKIEINRNNILKNEEALIDESSKNADPALKEILSTLLTIYLKNETKSIENSNNTNPVARELQFYKSLLHLLKITEQVFHNQIDLRDKLYQSIKSRFKQGVKKYEKKGNDGRTKIMFEDLFVAFYDKMNNTEKDAFDFIRSITESMAKYNDEMFALIERNSDYFEDMPRLYELHEHLRIWKEKYESSKSKPSVCMVYVGVKEKKPFPRDIREEVRKKYEDLKSVVN